MFSRALRLLSSENRTKHFTKQRKFGQRRRSRHFEILEPRLQMSAAQWVQIGKSHILNGDGKHFQIATQANEDLRIVAYYATNDTSNTHNVSVNYKAGNLTRHLAFTSDNNYYDTTITVPTSKLVFTANGKELTRKTSDKVDQVIVEVYHKVDANDPSLSFQQNRLQIDSATNALKYNNKPLAMVSYGDPGMLAEKSFNFVSFLNQLASAGVNSTRVWVNYHWADSLSPFQRVGRAQKYRLDNFNQEYFDKLKLFVQYAASKHIVVQVTLFNGSELLSATGKDNAWDNSPYNPSNHVELPGLDLSQGTFDNVDDPNIWGIHQKFIDKTADTLKDEPNVIYEVANEPSSHYMDETSSKFHEKVVAELTLHLRGDGQSIQPGIGSNVIMVDITPPSKSDTTGDVLRNWALNSPDVQVVAMHLAPHGKDNNIPANNDDPIFTYAQQLANSQVKNAAGKVITKAVVVSNDGDITQMTYQQAKARNETSANLRLLKDGGRLNKTINRLDNVFSSDPSNSKVGLIHFDFLEKGLNGDTWKKTESNYEVSIHGIDTDILRTLGNKAKVLNQETVRRSAAVELSDTRPLSVSNVAPTSLDLNWQTQDGVDGINVYVSTDSESYQLIATIGGELTSVHLSNLQENTQYFIKLVSFNAEYEVETDPIAVTTAIGRPVAIDDMFTTWTNQDVVAAVLANDTDFEGDVLSVVSFAQPAHGTVRRNPNDTNALMYTPQAGFNGDDQFTYRISDGHGGTAAATAVVRVLNRAPIANNKERTVGFNESESIPVLQNDTDPDGDPLHVRDFTQPAHGTVARSPNDSNRLIYTPNTNFFGDDSFTYQIGDGNGGRATATVFVHVSAPPVPHAPSDLAASSIGSTSLKLTWRDRSARETRFVIEISTDSTNWHKKMAIDANETSAQITGLSKNTTYFFRVVAVNDDVDQRSDPSNVVKIKTSR